MYRYAVSFVSQTQPNVRETIVLTKDDNTRNNNNNSSNTQAAEHGSGEVYASSLKAARVNANEKFIDKTIENVMKERDSGSFYA